MISVSLSGIASIAGVDPKDRVEADCVTKATTVAVLINFHRQRAAVGLSCSNRPTETLFSTSSVIVEVVLLTNLGMFVSADELSPQRWPVEGLCPYRTLKFFGGRRC